MKCKIFILTGILAMVTFAVTTVAKPSPQQETSQTARHNDNRKNEQGIEMETIPPPEKGIPFQSPPAKEGNPTISEDPPKIDWWARITNVIMAIGTLALAVVGSVAACAAIRTLRAIEGQTQALIEAQRPKISAKPHGDPAYTLADREAPRVVIELLNRGQTTANDFVYETWIEVLPVPFVDFTPSAEFVAFQEPIRLNPNDQPLVINIPIRKGLTDTERNQLENLRSRVCIRIHVRFKDAFSPSRNMDFGFYVVPGGLGFLSKYNTETQNKNPN